MPIASQPPGPAALQSPDHAGSGIGPGALAPPWRQPARVWLPVALLVACATLARQSGFDLWLADQLYALQGQRWALREHVLTSAVLHDGGRLLSQLAWTGVGLAWLASRRVDRLQRWRGPLARLAGSVLLSTLLVTVIKQLIPVHCPWDLLRYGGTAIAGDGGGVCFPSGHASAGYAWMALARVPQSPRWRRAGLACGIAAGVLFGFDQQLRGAHFLSHDMWAAALCWAVAVIVSPSVQERSA